MEFRFRRHQAGTFRLLAHADSPAHEDALIVTSSSSYTTNPNWVHALFSWDLAVPESHIYINDALDGGASVEADSLIAYTANDWTIGAGYPDLGGLNRFNGLISELYFAPGEFLDAVEKALKSDSCPFDTVFAQEERGIMGRNYTTGLLWSLETLAWDAEYLTRVVVLLGELAARDPGGSWANRPANSLSTILLPWLPQTCAPVQKRQTAVATLLTELPDIAWKLLLDLLPSSHQVSHGSNKPTTVHAGAPT